MIDQSLIAQHEGLLQGSTWGAVKICYDGSEEGGGIRIIDFKPMQTGRVSLDVFQECRRAFTVEEWIDLLIRTLGYEPAMYSEQEKIWLLCRLIPVVHNRVNMMELAPPGSGKSYVYNNVSRHVWLTAGEITPAGSVLQPPEQDARLVDALRRAGAGRGPVDQVLQRGRDPGPAEGIPGTRACTPAANAAATAECGLVLLANIELQRHPTRDYHGGKPMFAPARPDFIRRLPELFLESPLVDRFHGIIPGWEIPPFETEQQANGWG